MKPREVDYLVIGAGPAGLQMGYYLQEAGRDYLILEAGERPGTFFESFPRHRKLISINKIFTGSDDQETNLRWDWNSLLSDRGPLFSEYSQDYFPSSDVMVRYLGDFAEWANLEIQYGAKVDKVAKNGRFRVVDGEGRVYRSRRLIVATGLSRPYLPPIPGIELTENYVDVSVDPRDFTDQKVLVIGKGNSGFETADNLIPAAALIHVVSPNPLNLAWKTHFVGHLRAVNNNLLDTYQLKSQNAVLDGTLHKIERTEDNRFKIEISYTHAGGEREDLYYDRVICCTGFRFDDSIFDSSARPELCINDRFPHQTSSWESTNVKGLYIAGTLTQMRDFKKTTSGFIHGFRYNSRALHRILESEYHGVDWPSEIVDATPEALTEKLLQRINQSSALWQQFGFLGDVLSFSENQACYYEEMPVEWVSDSKIGASHYIVLTLEFGKIVGDPFNVERHPDPEKAQSSTFLHPVLRHYREGEKLGELHLLENLFGEWWGEDEHIRPLFNFLLEELRSTKREAAVPALT